MKNLVDKFFQGKNGEGKPPSKKTGYIVILAAVGLLLLVISNLFSEPDEPDALPPMEEEIQEEPQENIAEETSATASVEELEKSFQDELEGMLNQMQGVSEAEVMVNLGSTKVKVYEKNLIQGQQTTVENDSNGGTREVEDVTEETQVVLVRQGDKEVPLLTQTEKPEVSGVFIVAKGAEDATVEQWIVEAVSRVLDVSTHKVSVMPKD
ncbi:stage III sporulation protein AG [Lentibacillus sediminis]|uniref:stage III sporulation protein AG n=1 Tax=Lentibacillus sediminis TaxID=1940529 RepID=UPI000C1C6AED|nr:stage III sporulation protein AG [Lentibacillus sediminis]